VLFRSDIAYCYYRSLLYELQGAVRDEIIQGLKLPGCQVAVVTKFCVVVSNI